MNTYLVGGAVRDQLLGRTIKERDYVVVGSTPEAMIAMGFKQVGKDFPVFLHPKTQDEHALARTERKSGQGYGGFICDFNPDITLEEDLKRRDLTINAIAQSESGELIDPYGGQADLQARQLRHVSDAFGEDPLRVLRVARFFARYFYLGFHIAEGTQILMKSMVESGELNQLTKERVWLEVEKALEDRQFHHFLKALKDIHALEATLPYFSSICDATLEKAAKATKNLDKTSPFHLEAIFTLFLPDNAFNSKKEAQALKIPNSYIDACLEFQTNKSIFNGDKISQPGSILALFNVLDVWRRPEKLNRFCFIASALSKEVSADCEKLIELFEHTKQININEIIQQGFTGRDIKDQLEKRRFAIISKEL